MGDSNLPPEQWRSLFDEADIEFGYRPLASKIGTTHTRVRRVLRGAGTSEAALHEVAEALKVPVSKIRELRGEPGVTIEPFTLPDDAGWLNDNEREVIRSIVRALLDARGKNALEAAQKPATPAEGNEDEEEGLTQAVLDLAAREVKDQDKPI